VGQVGPFDSTGQAQRTAAQGEDARDLEQVFLSGAQRLFPADSPKGSAVPGYGALLPSVFSSRRAVGQNERRPAGVGAGGRKLLAFAKVFTDFDPEIGDLV
jgi:hypothetical protein